MYIMPENSSGKEGGEKGGMSPDGKVYIDETGRGQGRGCYLCVNSECISSAMKSGKMARALKSEIPTEIYDALKEKAGKINE